MNTTTRIQPGMDRSDKIAAMLDNFFDRTTPATSFREAYIEITGDRHVTGLLQHCDRQRLREAAGPFREAVSSTTFGDILADAVNRALIREYNTAEAYMDWRWLVEITQVRDFRNNIRARLGGYGALPVVTENAAYQPLTTPTDEAATFKVAKRGGTETVSVEAIANDDVGLIQRIPRALATAANRGVYEFVHEFLRTNAAIYDGAALFHADHDNIGTAALSAASYSAARMAIMRQTEMDSAAPIGLRMRHLVVPPELEETAYNLFIRTDNNDANFAQAVKPQLHVVTTWNDANNWYATADKEQVPLIELGFYGGEEPQLFLQDNPGAGTLFSNDQMTFKIRHIYSGAVMDYRGFYGGIVPGP